ncbi:MAG: DNA polymerase III subunit delta [Clostridia bacterium]|nr:DNA polymerase III subunit delta [Clostridia bacterium]
MPFIDEDKFNSMLKGEIKQNIFFFCGDDDYLKEFYCTKLTSKTVDESLKFFNFHVYEDGDTALDVIFADADNLPVMAEKTCLLVKNYPLDSLKSEETKEFEHSLKNIPESTVMIFYNSASHIPTGKNTKWDNIIKLFSELGTVVRIEHRTPHKTAKLLVSRAKEKGTSIDYETAMYLIDCVGDDLQTVLNEFNKVCAFSCSEPVTGEMIDMTAVKSVEASVFDISASIFSGDTDKAYKILSELLRQKTPASSIIGALASAYVNAYRLKVAYNADMRVEDFASVFQYKETKYTFNKIAPFVKKTKLSSLRQALDILSGADVKSKSSRISDEILLTELISKLASAV